MNTESLRRMHIGWSGSRVGGRFATGTVAAAGFAVLTAVAAHTAIPLAGTAVPFTFQVAAVLLAGILLGPRLGAASQVMYVMAGVAGLPAFAAGGGPAYLLGPTGGYLLAFPVAAALAGAVAGRGSWRWSAAGAVLGLAVIYAGGVGWLSVTLGMEAAFRLGALPFLPGDVLKLALVVLLSWRLRSPVRRALSGR
ncbi:MAG: biotin transporter BioY [Gemmatimonadota bacterium]